MTTMMVVSGGAGTKNLQSLGVAVSAAVARTAGIKSGLGELWDQRTSKKSFGKAGDHGQDHARLRESAGRQIR
jgi:hypothetical protein